MVDITDAERSAGYLLSAAEMYSDKLPKLSANLMFEAEKMKRHFDIKPMPQDVCCKYCGNLFKSGTFTVRIKKRQRETKKIKKLQRALEKRAQTSSFFRSRRKTIGEKIVERFNQSSTTVVRKCKLCGKRSKRSFGKKPPPKKQPEQEVVEKTLTKSMKRKLKKKKRRENQHLSSISKSSRDSGLDLSFSPAGHSTPLPGNPTQAQPSLLIKASPALKNPFLSLSTSSKNSSVSSSGNRSLLDSQQTQQGKPKNKRARAKLKHNPLESILKRDAKQKREKEKMSDLRSFLASL